MKKPEEIVMESRLRYYAFELAETEIALADLKAENAWLKEFQSGSEDIRYNKKRIELLEEKQERLNKRIEDIVVFIGATK